MPKEIILPVIAADFESGTIESWSKKEGDTVAKGEVLLSVETDKAIVEIEAEDSGVLGKIMVAAGTEDVPVNAVIGFLLQEGESASDLDGLSASVESQPVPTASELPSVSQEANAVAPQDTASVAQQSADGGRIFASPLARRIAADLGVEIKDLSGRGPRGRILKADVELAASSGSVAASTKSTDATPVVEPESGRAYTAIPHTNMRKTIARRLTESKRDVPHFYLSTDAQLDALLAVRKDFNARSPEGDGAYKLSVNDFIIKACALAMRDVPYAELAGLLNYLSVTTRPDIAIAVRQISKFMRNPGPQHWKMAKRVLAYLKGTSTMGLTFQGGSPVVLYGHSDSSHAEDKEHSRSTSGFLTMLAGAPINWGVKLQDDVSISTAESEFYGLYYLTLDVVGFRELLQELGFPQDGPTVIDCDNQSAISWAYGKGRLSCQKHIRLKYHFVQDAVRTKDTEVHYLETYRMPADFLTKVLGRELFQACRDSVMTLPNRRTSQLPVQGGVKVEDSNSEVTSATSAFQAPPASSESPAPESNDAPECSSSLDRDDRASFPDLDNDLPLMVSSALVPRKTASTANKDTVFRRFSEHELRQPITG